MVRSTVRAFALGSAVALGAVALGATAASAAPSTTEQDVVVAVTSSPKTADVPAADYTVDDVRTAASDPTWAAASLQPTAAAVDTLDPATAVLQRVDGRWQVADLGTAQVGCDVVSAAVVRELALSC